MIWVVLGAGIIFLLVMGQIRVYRTEILRTKCVDMAIHNRSAHGGYSHAEPAETVVARAVKFENYIRGIKPKEKKGDLPPPTQPPAAS